MDIYDLDKLLKDVNGSYTDFVNGVIHIMEDNASEKQINEFYTEIQSISDITPSEVILRAYEKVLPDTAEKIKSAGVTVNSIRNNDTPLDRWKKNE